MFIPINVIFALEDPEEAELRGSKVKEGIGELTINIKQICAFNENSNGHTNIRLSNGEVHEAIISYEDFIDLINTYSDNLLISGNN